MKQEKICKNCKFFFKNSCYCEKFKCGYREDDKIDPKGDEVHVENDEGWAFEVGERFGCVHFEDSVSEDKK